MLADGHRRSILGTPASSTVVRVVGADAIELGTPDRASQSPPRPSCPDATKLRLGRRGWSTRLTRAARRNSAPSRTRPRTRSSRQPRIPPLDPIRHVCCSPILPHWRPDAMRGSNGHHPPGSDGGPESGRLRESPVGISGRLLFVPLLECIPARFASTANSRCADSTIE